MKLKAPPIGSMPLSQLVQIKEVWLPLQATAWYDSCIIFSSGLYQMSVPESAPVGSVLGRIWAKDRDVGINAEMKYSIIDGDGRDTFDISTDPTNLFGIITVKKVGRKLIERMCLMLELTLTLFSCRPVIHQDNLVVSCSVLRPSAVQTCFFSPLYWK